MKTRMGRLAPMVAVPAMVLALAGCSGDDEPGGDETSGAASPGTSTSADPSGSGTPTTNPDDTTNPDIVPPPVLAEGSEGAVEDIKFDAASCKLEEGVQTVRGTLTNPTRETLDYVVTISWSNDTSDVRGQNFTTLENVAPRATVDWALRARVKSGATQCIPNVVRGQLRGRS